MMYDRTKRLKEEFSWPHFSVVALTLAMADNWESPLPYPMELEIGLRY